MQKKRCYVTLARFGKIMKNEAVCKYKSNGNFYTACGIKITTV